MSRVKRGVTARVRHKKIFEMAKGYRGRSKNVFRVAIEKVEKAFFRIKQASKILEVSFRIDKILQRYFYHLTNNFPTLIKVENNSDIFLHFKKPPKFSQEKIRRTF